jgi:hypothetical protein
MCYFALHKLHLFPHEVLSLPANEQAFIYAAIEIRAKAEKKAIDEAKKK